MTDEIDDEVYHVFATAEEALHITVCFPALCCPCEPDVRLEAGGVVIVHRRTH